MILTTPRLELIGCDLSVARAELDDPAAWARALNVAPPREWPPPLNDENSQRYFLDLLLNNPQDARWAMYYFVLVRSSSGKNLATRELVGNGGFKGPPTPAGVVEIGYSILPRFQRQGFASEAARALTAAALASPQVTRVAACTFPQLLASIAVMRKCGMRFIGAGPEAGTVLYGVGREEWHAATA